SHYRHARVGGHPEKPDILLRTSLLLKMPGFEAAQNDDWEVPGALLVLWIPAFAGMTVPLMLDLLG
ncbi:hypothetical protein, partial [Desulfogranum mediterraneum]|uniref:hypothetical protein n=1 Tax=Desulfogranum mediterraneum TaxID=160661 RepID=UPI000550E030